MYTYKLSFIPLGKVFIHRDKIYTKTNHNRGILRKENGSQEIHRFKKDTKVQYKESLIDLQWLYI